MRISTLALLVVVLPLAFAACQTGPTHEDVEALVRMEVEASEANARLDMFVLENKVSALQGCVDQLNRAINNLSGRTHDHQILESPFGGFFGTSAESAYVGTGSGSKFLGC